MCHGIVRALKLKACAVPRGHRRRPGGGGRSAGVGVGEDGGGLVRCTVSR